MYNFQQIKRFKAGPIFTELAGKMIGELTDEQCEQAAEDWIRAQFGHFNKFHRPHISLLLHVIDGLRAQQSSYIDVLFEGADTDARFVEVENPEGKSISVGEWIPRGNGLWALRIPRPEMPKASE